METLKDKGVELHKGVYKKVWLEKDIKEAVSEFIKVNCCCDQMISIGECHICKSSQEIFGHWED